MLTSGGLPGSLLGTGHDETSAWVFRLVDGKVVGKDENGILQV